MSDNQLDYISTLLDLMATKNFLPSNMDKKDRDSLETDLSFRAGQLMTQYKLDRDEAAKLAEDDKQRKAIERNIENLAKALPNISRSTITAINAFKKNDPIGGSAALMDVCASVAPLIGGLAAAGGPPGMLIGALFALVGQILAFFAPKAESLTSQIETLLRTLTAEDKQQTMLGVYQNIDLYTANLRNASQAVAREFEAPLLSIEIVDRLVNMLNPLEGNTVQDFKRVMNWLAEKNNQDQALWPVILEMACHAWSNMLMASTQLVAMVHTDKLQAYYDAARHLDEQRRRDVEVALVNLQASVIARVLALAALNQLVLKMLEGLIPAARDSGRLWLIDDTAKGHLYAFTHILKGDTTYLGGELKRLAVTVAAKDLAAPDPDYHLFALEPWIDQGYSGYDRTYHGIAKSPYTQVDWKEINCDVRSLHALTDIWTVPGAGENELAFFAAKDNAIREFVLDASRNTRFVKDHALKAKATTVRVVDNPRPAGHDSAENARALVLNKPDRILYGGCLSPEIYVCWQEKAGYVGAPWGDYQGLAVDAHHLWAFEHERIACATHASILRCLNGEIGKPEWIEYRADQLLYTDEYHKRKNEVRQLPPLKGIVDLGACDDGTIVASIFTRSVITRSYGGRSVHTYAETIDRNALYTGRYAIDPGSAALSVSWEKIGATTGNRLQKTPVFCWDALLGLISMLREMNPVLKQPIAAS